MINLVASHWVRFKTTRKNFGIAMTHAGVLLLLLGQFVTELVQSESALRLENAAFATAGRQRCDRFCGTSLSWFSVNLLGVGLHTYGFMEGA